ncbi:MAG: hypothetical protein FJ098_12630, partial [Deltaproteobacteria bacterium]|nr:hypothetical protein [Deltaproteobacteria bacterium]
EGRTSWTPASGTSCIPEANPCTDSGTCQEGFCVPDAVGVDCASDADCSGHDDGNLCNGLWTCVDCECTFDPGSVVACQGEDSECAALVCEPATGTCIPFLDPDGTGCDDGDPCTTGDACLSGECQPGEVSIPVWTPLAGPDGLWLDMVVTLPGSPSTFLAVGRGGAVFRSLDAGQSWERGDLLGWGEERGDWLTVAHGTTASILVIYGGTLFRSLDGGIQWSELMDGCAAVTECAAVPGTFVAACNGKTWLSQDGGATFAQSGGDLPGGGAEVVALAARDVATWHVGTRNEDDSGRGRVYRTTDGGNSWGEVTLPGAPDPVAVSRHGLLVHPSSPDRVFAGLSSPEGEVFLAAQAVLFRSADTGVTWETLAPTPMGASMVPLTLDSIGRLLVGADRSLSRGGNFGSGPWAFIPGPPPGSPVQLHDITQVLVDPANEFSFYVPAANGLAYAKELGQLWTVLTGGLRGGRFNQLLVTASGSLLAAEPDGGRVVRSSDGGHTWAAAPLSLTGEALVLAGMAESPGGRLFGVTTEGGLVRSDSGGADWIHLDPDSNPLFTPITSVAAPTPPGEGQGRVLAFLRGVGLWINDNGAIPGVDDNWSASPLPVGEALSLVPLLGSSTILFLGTAADPATGIARIWRSTSGGDFWSQVASGQGDGFLVFAHPGNSSMAYAALLGKNPTLYQTTNSGGSWAALPKQLTFANVRGDGGLLADPAVPEGLYAAFWLSGVWRFDPAAAAWARLEGSPRTATTLAVDASTPGRLLAGDGSDAVL